MPGNCGRSQRLVIDQELGGIAGQHHRQPVLGVGGIRQLRYQLIDGLFSGIQRSFRIVHHALRQRIIDQDHTFDLL